MGEASKKPSIGRGRDSRLGVRQRREFLDMILNGLPLPNEAFENQIGDMDFSMMLEPPIRIGTRIWDTK